MDFLRRAPRGARGLKPFDPDYFGIDAPSRPARGAWIETRAEVHEHRPIGRAPRGARGLKRSGCQHGKGDVWSRPARGAWIETANPPITKVSEASRPARGAWIETRIPRAN